MSSVPTVPDNVALAIQACAVDTLQAGAEFDRVPILGRRRTNIQNDIDAAIDALGACIYVLPGLPLKFEVGSGTPYASLYELRVRVIETDTLNTSLPTAYELVEFVVRRLFGQDFAAIEGMSPLLPAEGSPVTPVEDPERVIYDVIWHTSLGYLPRVGA